MKLTTIFKNIYIHPRMNSGINEIELVDFTNIERRYIATRIQIQLSVLSSVSHPTFLSIFFEVQLKIQRTIFFM